MRSKKAEREVENFIPQMEKSEIVQHFAKKEITRRTI